MFPLETNYLTIMNGTSTVKIMDLTFVLRPLDQRLNGLKRRCHGKYNFGPKSKLVDLNHSDTELKYRIVDRRTTS